MKDELFSTLKQSVEILQNDMAPQNEPVWLGTLWNVDQSLAKMAEKYLASEKQKQFDLLDTIAVENEKKNKRIRELEECLKSSFSAIEQAKSQMDAEWRSFDKTAKRCDEAVRMYQNRVEQLLNQKP